MSEKIRKRIEFDIEYLNDEIIEKKAEIGILENRIDELKKRLTK